MSEQLPPDLLPKRSSDYWQKMYFPTIVLLLGGGYIAWNSLFYFLGWEAPMSDQIVDDMRQGEKSSSETGAMSAVMPTTTPMVIETPTIVTEDQSQVEVADGESSEPFFGEGWRMVFDYLGRGINVACYGVTAENTGKGYKVLDVLDDHFYSGLGVWVLEDYLVVHPDGTFEVKKGIRSKFENATFGNTYCVDPPY